MTDNTANHGHCLTDETLTDYLEGVLEPAVKTVSEVHLVSCDACRVKLAFFMRLLKEEMAPEEVFALSSIQQEWTRARNDQRLPSRRGVDFRRWKIASGGVAAAVLLAFGAQVALDRVGEPRSANEVIQLLLAENRPFEARISGQPHRPFTLTRGPGDRGAAPGLLKGQLSRLSATTYEMGQFHLLQKDFGDAIRYLELAERELGNKAEVHNDLGVAYMESNNAPNHLRASTEFNHALELNGDFAPAIFNLAVLYGRLGRTDQSEMFWNRYLRLESDREWLNEAKLRLEGIKH